MSGEETAKVQRLIEFLAAEFPGSAPVPELRVLEALKSNGGSQDGAYLELMEEQQRSKWEVTAPKSKKKQQQQDRNNATSGPNSSAPSNMALGRGRGGRGRGMGREGDMRDGGFRDNRDGGRFDSERRFDSENNRGGLSRGRGGPGAVRGGRGGGRGQPQDAPGGMPAAAPMNQAIDTAPKAPPAQAVAPPQPAAAPSVPRDAPPVVHNQWSQGRPKTQEELPKPPPEVKPAVKQQPPGPVWNGSQAKPQNQASAAGDAATQAAMKPVVQAPSMPAPAPAPVQAPQQVPATSGQSAISANSGGAATAQAQAQATASQFDQSLSSMSQNLSHLGLSDATNGQMQAMHKSPQKTSMPEQSVGSATNTAAAALQQDTMSHDYSAQFAAPNAANAQQYSQQSGLGQFQYQQQAPMAGAEQAQGGDALYNDPSKMQGMGGYGQLDATSFSGMGGNDSNKGYGHNSNNNYGGGNGGGKGYGGKGANAAGNNAAGNNNMPMQNWQQQQQNNMMGTTWAPNPYMNYNMANMPNMNNFNMAMYMQQAAAAGQYGGYPMQHMFQSMPNTQAGGLGGNTGGSGGGGGGKNFQQKKGGAGGGGYNNNNQGSNYSASNYSNYAADPSSTAQDKYGGGAAGYNAPYYNNMNFPPSYDTSMGSMAYNQQGAQGFSNMGRTTGASNTATGMNNSMGGMDPQSSMMGYTAPGNFPAATGGYAAFQQGSNAQQGGWESQPN